MDRPASPLQDRVIAWTQQVRHGRALRTVLERFGAEQIPALPVKGIVSAHTLYPDVADRLLTDVDLQIRPRDFERVLALSRREGWRVIQRMRAYGNVVFIVDGVCIDAQGFVAGVPWLSRLSVETMLTRARRSEVLGFPHLLPDFDDHAVVLLLNVFKDKLIHAFAWSVRDVERLPNRNEFDPRRLAARLRETGASTIGWLVADWMVRERGIVAWSAVRDAIHRGPPRAAYVSTLAWLREIQPRGALAFRILSRMGADYPIDRARAMTRMFWWQAEAWASQWSDAPFRRQDPAAVKGTIFGEGARRSR